MLFIHTVGWTHTHAHLVLEWPLPQLNNLTLPTKTNGKIHHTAWSQFLVLVLVQVLVPAVQD